MKSTSIQNGLEINILAADLNYWVSLTEVYSDGGASTYDLVINTNVPEYPEPITKIPGQNVKGVWKPTIDSSKRIQAEWELNHMESRISINAPVIFLFGHKDVNV